MTTNVEHIFMYLSTICIFSFVKLKSVAYILNFFFLLSCVHFSYLSDTTPSSDICVKNIFSPSGLPMNLPKRIFLWAEVFIISEVNCFYVFRLWNIGHLKVAKIFCVFERILWFSVGLLSIVSSFWHVICRRGHIDLFSPWNRYLSIADVTSHRKHSGFQEHEFVVRVLEGRSPKCVLLGW